MEQSLAERIFGKQLDALQFEDIEEYFKENQEENTLIEHKSGDVSLEKIYNETCAFLNTNGGIIIIGSPRETEFEGKKLCHGKLTNSTFKSKDWLVQKIASAIQPSPIGISIIERTKSNIKIFICEVKQSTNPPHQSSDGKYYIRLETEAKFAPHGIVQALFNRRKLPELEIKLKMAYNDTVNETDGLLATIQVCNKTEIPADNIHYMIDVYNTEEVLHNEFATIQTDYKKQTHTSKINLPLVHPLKVPVSFAYRTIQPKHVIFFMAWSNQIPMQIKYWLINSDSIEIEYEGELSSPKTLSQVVEDAISFNQ